MATYCRQFQAVARGNQWHEVEKATLLVLALDRPAAELLQKVPVDSQNTYSEGKGIGIILMATSISARGTRRNLNLEGGVRKRVFD